LYATGGTATLGISEGLIAVASVGWIALQPIVHATYLNNGWRLLELHDGTFLSWLVIRINRAISFNAVDFNRIVAASSFDVFTLRVVYWTTLTGNSHYLWLIASAFQI
jgi:hypothetical protein